MGSVASRSAPPIKSDRLLLELISTWIKKNASLIHAESLQKHIKNIKSHLDQAILGAMLIHSGDKRLKLVAKTIPKANDSDNLEIHKSIKLAAEIGQVPFDPYFLEFGIKISKLDPAPEKKMIPKHFVIKSNPFLFCRALFGANWRADIAALLTLKKVTPTEISKLLGCSYETSHRNYQSLNLLGWPNITLHNL